MCFPAIETSIKLVQGWKIASSSVSGWYVYKVGIASSHMNLVGSLLSGWYGYKVGVASSHMNLVGSLLSGWYEYKVGVASSHMNLVGSLLSVLLPSIAVIRSSPMYQTDIRP
jgi:phage-related protein